MWIWQQVGAGWRRFGFAQDMDYEEYGLWEDEDAMEYGEERSGQDSPFDDPFFKSFRPRKKKVPEQQGGPRRSQREPPMPQERLLRQGGGEEDYIGGFRLKIHIYC